VVRVPPAGSATGQIRPGPKQLSIRTAAGVSTVNGLTLHVRGNAGNVNYQPPVVTADGPANPQAIQQASDGPAAGSLTVLQPGIYHENVVFSKRVKLQGLGVGGIVGAGELQQRQPEDPRFSILGTGIDGRFFADNTAAWQATVDALGSLAGVDADHPV